MGRKFQPKTLPLSALPSFFLADPGFFLSLPLSCNIDEIYVVISSASGPNKLIPEKDPKNEERSKLEAIT